MSRDAWAARLYLRQSLAALSCRQRRFQNADSITGLIGAVLLELNDEYQLQHR